MTRVELAGDFAEVSDWNDRWETDRELPPAPLWASEYPRWARGLLRDPALMALVGGEAICKQFELMLVPRMSWNDDRGDAIGFPVYEDGKLVNCVRRFLDGREPRYQGVRGRGHNLWPDRLLLPPVNEYVVLCCGMRDACFCWANGIPAWTTTGGVNTWPKEWIQWLAPNRHFFVCFDKDELIYSTALSRKLLAMGAEDVEVIDLKQECKGAYKDLAEVPASELQQLLGR